MLSHDQYVSGIGNSKGIFWREVGLRRQYDLFMVRRQRNRRVCLKGKHSVTQGTTARSIMKDQDLLMVVESGKGEGNVCGQEGELLI